MEQLVYICGTLSLIHAMSPSVKHVFGGPRSGERDPSVFVMYAFLIACMR